MEEVLIFDGRILRARTVYPVGICKVFSGYTKFSDSSCFLLLARLLIQPWRTSHTLQHSILLITSIQTIKNIYHAFIHYSCSLNQQSLSAATSSSILNSASNTYTYISRHIEIDNSKKRGAAPRALNAESIQVQRCASIRIERADPHSCV